MDTLIAALLVGPTGRAVGIDMIPEMLERAKKSFREVALKGVTFQEPPLKIYLFQMRASMW